MDRPLHLRGLLAAALALLMLSSACGGEAAETTARAAPDDAPATRTVPDATGTVELPTSYERVVTTDGVYAANLYSLGVEPVAVPSDVKLQLSTLADHLPEGTDLTDLPEVGVQGEIDLEALAALDPDLVIATDWEAENADLFRAIAPTYFVEWPDNGAWRPRFVRVAEALGREEQAQQVSDAFDAFVAELPEEVTERTVAFVRASSRTDIRADILATSFAGSVAREAGIPLLDLADAVDVPADASWIDLSEESLDLLAGADVIVISDLSFYDPEVEPTDRVLAGSPLWETLPAVQQGDVVMVPGPVYNGGSYQAATALLGAIARTTEAR